MMLYVVESCTILHGFLWFPGIDSTGTEGRAEEGLQ